VYFRLALKFVFYLFLILAKAFVLKENTNRKRPSNDLENSLVNAIDANKKKNQPLKLPLQKPTKEKTRSCSATKSITTQKQKIRKTKNELWKSHPEIVVELSDVKDENKVLKRACQIMLISITKKLIRFALLSTIEYR
jgi:hypothetical protein